MKISDTVSAHVVDLCGQIVPVIDQTLNKYVAFNNQLGTEDKNAYIVADLGDVLRKVALWRRHLPHVKPFYAVKCNNDQTILNMISKCGLGFDCASKAELNQILAMGVDPDRIIYANPCKQRSHLKFAANNAVDLMTFDNKSELYKIKAISPDARCVLRILPPIDGDAQCPLGMKFGCPVEECEELLKSALSLQINIMGVSFHVGSGCSNVVAFSSAVRAAREVFDIAETLGFEMTLLDIGGGFPGQSGQTINLEEICAEMCPVLESLFPEDCGVSIIAEPGRFFVASAFTLAVNVISRRLECIEGSASSELAYRYYVNDGVYGSFNCLLFDHAVVEPLLMDKKLNTVCTKQICKKLYRSSVWGPTCDALDCLHSDCKLPELLTGDWLMYANMGAYTLSAGTTFNGMPSPLRHYVLHREWLDETMFTPIFPPVELSDSGRESVDEEVILTEQHA